VTSAAGQAPGVVKVRLCGDPASIDAVAEVLAGWTLDRSAPYLNRRDPGQRVYLTLLIPPSPAGTGPRP
jgi:hypothetical protein